jgi:anti-sigma-K factor RskA
MKSPTPENHDDEHHAMREALQRDAARLREEPFDAGLHYATMRRIRALGGADRSHPGWRVVALGAACVLMLIAVVSFVSWRSPPPVVAVADHPAESVAAEPARASAWSYQLAARQGDEALLAMLDRDARDLLPPTAGAFSNPLR